MAAYPRRLDVSVELLLREYPAVLLTGPRQVGKSTLAKQIAVQRPSIRFDLEDLKERNWLATRPDVVLRQHTDNLIIIDEVQHIPDLFMQLRVIIDEEIDKGNSTGRFLLLGSASGDLQRQTSESLAGRIARVRLHGLDWLEVAADGDFGRLWSRGGYPRSYLATSDEASLDWRKEYLEDVMKRDVVSLGMRIDPIKLYELLALLADKQGSIAVVSDLGRDLGMDRSVVARYLSMLEELMLIRKLPAYATNVRKRVVKQPKYYICDSGLLHCLCNITPHVDERLALPRLIGASWEGFVIENLIAVMPKHWRASFYRDHGQNEVDLILEQPGGKPWAIEIKRSKNSSFSKACRRALHALQPERTFLVHGDSGRSMMGADTESLGLEEMMNELWGQRDHGIANAVRYRSIYTGSECAALLAALAEGKPNVPLLRRDLVRSSLRKAEAVVLESADVNDRNFRLRWAQVRDELQQWLDAETKILLEDTRDSSYVVELRTMLEGLLKIKLSLAGMESRRANYYAAGWCAFEMFVRAVGVLLRNEKFKVISYLLSREYAGNLTSSEFGKVHTMLGDGRPEDLRQFVFEGKDEEAYKLLEAEIIILLFDAFEASKDLRRKVFWWPLLLDRKLLNSDFLIWAGSKEGRDNIQACLGATCDEFALLNGSIRKALSGSALDDLYKRNVMNCLERICWA